MRPTECDYEGCVRWIALALLGPKKADSFGIGLWRKYVTYPRRYQCYAAHGKCFCSNFMFHVSVRFRFDSRCNRFLCKRCNEGKRSLATRLATIAQRNWCVYFVVFCCPKRLTGSWPTAEKHSLTNTLMQLVLLTLNGFASLFCCLFFFAAHISIFLTFYILPKGVPALLHVGFLNSRTSLHHSLIAVAFSFACWNCI